jgi:hypothetical protein
MISTSRFRTLPVLLAFLLACGCTRSGDGSGGQVVGPASSPLASGRFLLRDATIDELLSFSAEVNGVSVVYDDDTVSDNLLSAPFRVELLSLGEFSKWMAQSRFDIGTVEAIQVSFTPFSYLARSLDGTEVQVDALSDSYVSPLAVEAVVDEDEVVTFVTDLDLQDSLSGDVSDGMIVFDPEGVSRAADPGELLPVDRFIGLVQFRDTGTLDLVVEGFVDDDRFASLGPIPIFADAFTLCLDRNLFFGYSSLAEFYTVLYPALTLVELHGVLEAGGDFIASRIEIEDQDGGAGATYPYKLRGTVTDRTPGVARLRIQSIPRGAEFALPVLEGLGDPAGTNISFSSQKLRVLLGNEVLLPTAVLVGDELDVKFQVFPSQPFPAVVVSIRGVEPGLQGTISDTGGLPTSFVMNVSEFDPAVLAGNVEADDTDVIVKLNVNLTQIVLGTIFTPMLQANDLVTDLGVRANGQLSGTPEVPVLDAARILVRPALLDRAQVASVDVGASTFTAVGGEVVGSFGGAFMPSASYSVTVEPQATLVGEADGIVALADALAALMPGETLLVDVQGIGSDVPDEIRGYQILSFVE